VFHAKLHQKIKRLTNISRWFDSKQRHHLCAIEVWAECELAALHALHRLARTASPADSAALQDRASEAIHWHLEHTQPDNSTNRPWALHAFLLADRPGGIGTGDASLYAETLLHNMCATDARNEPLSRWILADAARELRLATAT